MSERVWRYSEWEKILNITSFVIIPDSSLKTNLAWVEPNGHSGSPICWNNNSYFPSGDTEESTGFIRYFVAYVKLPIRVAINPQKTPTITNNVLIAVFFTQIHPIKDTMVIIIEIINIILYTLPILHPYLLHNMDKIFPCFVPPIFVSFLLYSSLLSNLQSLHNNFLLIISITFVRF